MDDWMILERYGMCIHCLEDPDRPCDCRPLYTSKKTEKKIMEFQDTFRAKYLPDSEVGNSMKVKDDCRQSSQRINREEKTWR